MFASRIDKVIESLLLSNMMNPSQVNKESSLLYILIEGTKLADEYNDGIKRFVITLLRALVLTKEHKTGAMKVDVKVFDETLTLVEAIEKYGKVNQPVAEMESPLQSGSTTDRSVIMIFKSKIGFLLYKSGVISFFKFILNRRQSRTTTKYDIVHYTLPQIMRPWGISKYHLVTVHDATHYTHKAYHEQKNVENAELGFSLIRERRPFVHAISRSTCDAIGTIDPLILDRTTCIYEAVDHKVFYPERNQDQIEAICAKYGLVGVRYLLCLSTNEPRKNLANTVNAFLRMKEQYGDDIKLIIGGKPGWKSEPLPIHQSIMNLGYIPDEDLRVLYGSALAFCFISHHEGFGLPPIEAMSCRTVPIYGNNSAMAEIIGEFGLPANPNDIESIACQMKILTFNEQVRTKMEHRAYAHSKQFSLTAFGDDMIAYYQNITKNSIDNSD